MPDFVEIVYVREVGVCVCMCVRTHVCVCVCPHPEGINNSSHEIHS